MNEEAVATKAKDIIAQLDNNPLSKKESQQVEFKENIQNELFIRYAKSLASFANNKGGMIIFGVKNSPHTPIGTTSHTTFNRDRLGRVIERFFSPLIDWQMTIVEVDTRQFPVLYVDKNPGEIYVCLEENNAERLHTGDIFFRYNSENKKIAPNELQRLLQEIKEAERTAVLSKVNVIANSNPKDLLIANLAEKTLPELGGKLVIEESVAKDLRFIKEGQLAPKGRPVLKIISEVQPIAVKPVRKGSGGVSVELNEQNYREFFPFTHDELVTELKKLKPDFIQSPRFNSLKKALRKARVNELAYHRTLRNPNETGMWFYNQDYVSELLKKLTD